MAETPYQPGLTFSTPLDNAYSYTAQVINGVLHGSWPATPDHHEFRAGDMDRCWDCFHSAEHRDGPRWAEALRRSVPA